MESLFTLIKKLIADRFYGRIILIFESGKIVRAEKRESVKFD